jgi:Tfp pilus assembly protein PilF
VEGNRKLQTEVRRVLVWSGHDAQDRLVLRGPLGRLSAVALSGDGRRVLGRDEGGAVHAWDVVTGRPLVDPPEQMPEGAGDRAEAGGLRVHLEDGAIRVYRPELEGARRRREARDRERLARLAGTDPDWHRGQVDESLEAGDDFAASAHLRRLLRVEPWDAASHLRQAHLLAHQGKHAESAAHLIQAVLLNPRAPLWPVDPGAARRARRAGLAKDWPRAVREFRLAAAQPRATTDVLEELATAQELAGDSPGARATLTEIGRLAGDEARLRAAGSLFAHGLGGTWELSLVRAIADQAARDAARGPSAATLRRFGAILLRTGQFAEAGKRLAEAQTRQNKGGLSDTLPYLAVLARVEGRYEEAVALLERYETHRKSNRRSLLLQEQREPGSTWRAEALGDALQASARKLVLTPPPMPRAEAAR